MARGWESKNVEEQQAERERGPAPAPGAPVDAERARRQKTLELSRARVAADLAAASHARHREMLEAALADLDRQLREL